MGVKYLELGVETSKKTQIVNLTKEVCESCGKLGVAEGILLVSVRHTTCALVVNEDENGLRHDFERLGEALLNPFRGDEGYRHDSIDDNAQAHLTSNLLGHSILLPLRSHQPLLGTWQNILLLEMDGPRRRKVDLTLLGQ
jgi:secondary thiamine-phosphate synthase enzyme